MCSTEFSHKIGVVTELLTLVKSGVEFVFKHAVKHPKIFKVNKQLNEKKSWLVYLQFRQV